MSGLILENLLVSDTFWLAIASVGALITLAFIYYQIRTSRMIAASNFLLELVKKFDSKDMRICRKRLAKAIKETPGDNQKIDACSDVPGFFDDVGLLLKMKAVPIEIVWSSFSYWVLGYYRLLDNYINWARKEDNDPSYYAYFEYLVEKTLKFDRKMRRKRHKKVVTPKQLEESVTKKQLDGLIHEEMTLKT